MKIQYSNNVKNTLKEYANSLKKYPISKERRNQKVRQLKQFLRNTIKQTAENIGTFSYPVCRYEDLGQILDVNRNPLNQHLRQTQFSDESKTLWEISFILLEDNRTIFICCLKQGRFVVKESQLRRIIQESIKKILNII